MQAGLDRHPLSNTTPGGKLLASLGAYQVSRDEITDVLYSHTHFVLSSRSLHTRFDCDWSSDVCSSDLGSPPTLQKSAYCAARRSVTFSPLPPIMIGGRGFCTGIGSLYASSIV